MARDYLLTGMYFFRRCLGVPPARSKRVVMALVLALQRIGDLVRTRKLAIPLKITQTFDQGRGCTVTFGRRDQFLPPGRIVCVFEVPPHAALVWFHCFLRNYLASRTCCQEYQKLLCSGLEATCLPK